MRQLQPPVAADAHGPLCLLRQQDHARAVRGTLAAAARARARVVAVDRSEDRVNFIKVRTVRSRYYGMPATFEGIITHRDGSAPSAPVWKVVGRTRGHATREEAQGYAIRLADRRGLKLENDPRRDLDPGKTLRRAELRDRYGDT